MKWSLCVAAAALFLLTPAAVHAAGPGSVDVSFGEAGQAGGVVGGGVTTLAGGLVQQADGGIVAAGSYQVVRRGETFPGQQYAALARFTADGELDREYGTEGWTLDERYQVTGHPARQRDGKVVVAGGRMSDAADGTARAVVARYEADGSVDKTFGDGGVVAVDLPLVWAMTNAAAVDREGRIVLAVQGQEEKFGGPMRYGVARLEADGSPDRRFGGDGATLVPASAGEREAAAVALLPDGGAVLAAQSRTQEPILLARFDERGRAVGSWQRDGLLDVGFAGDVGELELDAEDRLVLVGGHGTAPYPRSASVLRLGVDGSRDATFGVDGAFSAKIGAGTDITSSVLQPDGKRVVGGGFFKPRAVPTPPPGPPVPTLDATSGTTGWALMRIRPDGKLDRRFGGDGRVTSPLGPSFSHVQDLILQEDGRYVAGGTSTGCGGATLTLVRYHGDATGAGQPDPGPIVRPCPGMAPVDSSGIELTIACPLVEVACEGEIVLEVPVGQYVEAPVAPAGRARTVRVARSRYRTAGNRRHVARVKLSRKGRRMVKRGKRFRAKATIASRDRRGKRRVTRAWVTVAAHRR